MKKTIYITCAVLALVSCEMRFELDIPKEDSKIFALCVPGARDSTAVIVDIARYAGDDIVLDMSKVKTKILVNGERQEVQYQPKYRFPYDSQDHSVPQESFYITRKMNTGDEVSLTVSYPGLESVSAVTTIPEMPKDACFTIESDDRDESSRAGSRFILEYSDPSEDSYYAVVFRERTHDFRVWGYIEDNGEVITDTSEYISWNEHIIDHEFDPFQSDTEFQYEAYNNRTGLLFWKNSDALDNGGRKMVFYNTYTMLDYSFRANDLNYGYTDISYEATIYRISEDLYRYYHSNLLADNNSLSYFGLSLGNATFSNIKGGFGVLGGMAGQVLTADVD